MKQARHWPVLRSYDARHLRRIAMPIGGIGTGTVSLGGRGDLRDWEIVNRPAKGFVPKHSFFTLFARPVGGQPVTRVLEGPLDTSLYQHGFGGGGNGLPRFRNCRFDAAYPLAQVHLTDPAVPLKVRIEAFNPLIPADPEHSGIPVAVLRFVLSNPTKKAVDAAVCGSIENFIGKDGSQTTGDFAGQPVFTGSRDNHNTQRNGAVARGVLLSSSGVPRDAEQWGTIALATTAKSGVTCRTAWADVSWGDSLLDFWDDFSADGLLDQRERGKVENPQASVAAKLRVPARGERTVTFLLSWHFPNRRTWTPAKAEAACCTDGACAPKADPNIIGNYYCTKYADAWDVAEKVQPMLARLAAQTVQFVSAMCESDLPEPIKDAALSNVSTLRSQTVFRTPDGLMYGWEGCGDHAGCCNGSCTHVWNYDQATAFLFGSLSRGMREVEFAHAMRPTGHMSFRTHLPLGRESWFMAAADGQMGCLVKLCRDWQLSGDDEMLRRLWPLARKALEFCWVPGGWDADRDGVMEGCQHNTMDVEYYGPNPQISVMYLAALRACEQMARHIGDEPFAQTCRGLSESGRRKIDAELFNGEYYQQQIVPISDPAAIAPGLRSEMGSPDTREPALQIGPGCEVNQLFGQHLADVAGLGELLDAGQMRAAMRAMMRHNFCDDLSGHFNPMRSYALGDEAGLLMCTWPRGGRPKRPSPYASEVWTGLEYMVAALLITHGMRDQGLRVVRAARDRHEGQKRNPFDEPECGHHYARALSSWAALLAWSGFAYSAVDGALSLGGTPKSSSVLFSTGQAWGMCRQTPRRKASALQITVLHGEIRLSKVTLTGIGALALAHPRALRAGQSAIFNVPRLTRRRTTPR
jgi:uncharacterized protein (DUF608 family)